MKIAFVLLLTIISFSFKRSELPTYPNNNQAILWEVNHPNISKTSYIFGTMHLIDEEYFFYPKLLKKKIKKASTLILELNEIPDSKSVLQHTKLKSGDFFDYFTLKQTDQILEWAKKRLNMEAQVFRSTFYNTKPFVFSQILTQSLFDGKTESYEKKIYQYSKDKSVPIVGLESIEFQLNLMDALSKQDQAQMVLDLINKEKEIKKDLIKLQKLYRDQKIDSIYLEINNDMNPISKYEDIFIINRNYKWIPKIEEEFKKCSCFLAVGAGHLGGPNGLLRILEKKGYQLKPIYLNKK